MRNQEAARYARWAGGAAIAMALLVVGIYVERAIRASRRHHEGPRVVPAAVQQQTETFSYKRVEKDRTIFTIRASRATQFKEGDQAVLEDVWITIYGQEGDRNDNIHTRECSYDQKTGSVECKGDLTIDIQAANSGSNGSSKPSEQSSMQIKTSNLTFDGQTGEASTPAPVNFTLPQGHGSGIGVTYSTQSAIVRIQHEVRFETSPSAQTTGRPVAISGSSLEVRRNDRLVVLAGPAAVREDGRELSAGRISVDLDENFHARRAVAEGHPSIHGPGGPATFAVAAESFEGFLNPEGWVQRIVADGSVAGTRTSPQGTDNFSCAHVEVTLEPQRNVLREMTATGLVTAESQGGPISQRLETSALRVKFSEPSQSEGQSARHLESAAQKEPNPQPERQRMESAETLTPGKIVSKNGDETTELRAPRFTMRFKEDGHVGQLLGSGGVEARGQKGNSPVQVSTAQMLSATFGPDGQWTTVDEKGEVHFQQGDRRATAAEARIDRAPDQVVLAGSPVLTDSMSRTTAQAVTIEQKSGRIDAQGSVISTYLPSEHGDSVNLGSGPAHITADQLSGSTTMGEGIYSGHARLWQGESVLDADQIALWRNEKKMQATGNVVAVFPQTSGPSLKQPPQSTGRASNSAPGLWYVRAPALTYWNDQNKARLEGGVTAASQQGSIESQTLDVYLSSTAPAAGMASASLQQSGAGGSGQLSRVVAEGNVKVSQNLRIGSADEAEYTAPDEKFVLSGGKPTLTDASGNVTTGRSLTFFVASDTILVDSEAGSRTLTKHRVEK